MNKKLKSVVILLGLICILLFALVQRPQPNIKKDEKKKIILPEKTWIYTVKAGDTLSELAAIFKVDPDVIVAINNIANSSYIWIGEKLEIPVQQ